jgi:4-hydroxy-3-methylbut-2-enyl diphosphate reductase
MWLSNDAGIGISAGAPALEALVNSVGDWLREHGYAELQTLTVREENVRFGQPEELR